MADDVVVVVKGLTDFAEKVMKKLTLDITANLIEDTPVDTGWARANWVPQVGTPFEDLEQALHRKDKEARVSEAAQAQSTGLASVASYTLPAGEIFITNNVEYIESLNEGSSAQAPAAFVQKAIQRALEEIAVEV